MPTKKMNPQEEEDIVVDIVAESLAIDDSLYETTLPTKYKNRKPYKAKDPNNITAFMPGTVRKIFVHEGDVVRKGAKILVVDAMKMNNELLAPMDGQIKKIPVKTGDNVPKNTVLAEMLPLKKGQKFTDKKK